VVDIEDDDDDDVENDCRLALFEYPRFVVEVLVVVGANDSTLTHDAVNNTMHGSARRFDVIIFIPMN